MKIKKTQTVAYEAAEYYSPLRGLKLLGTEGLYTQFPRIRDAKVSSKTNSFLVAYDLEDDFYYRFDIIVNSESVANEIGVGELVEHDGNIILKRTQPLYVQAQGEERRVAYGVRPIDLTSNEDLIMVTSYTPSNIIEALPDPHMIIISLADHHPHPLKIEENSLIGRLDDTIESIKISDLPNVAPSYDDIADAPLIKGSIVFDNEWDTLKYYNGKEWRSL